ncbi:MAG: hypothetical protein ABIW76_03500, partial [Fibrobacteria bacterium]
ATGAGTPASMPQNLPAASADLDQVKKKSPPERVMPAVQTESASFPDSEAAAPIKAEPGSVNPGAVQASAAADFETASTSRPDASAEFAEFAAPTAVLTPERQENRDPLADFASLQQADPDLEQERDLDADPEDPEAVTAPIAPPAPAAVPESLTVPAQDSPARLPALWPVLVAEFMSLRPLLGSNLRHSRLEWEAGETPALRVVFLDRTSYSLIEDDGDFRKSIQGFLASKAKGRQDYPVRFTLDPDAAAAGAPAAAAMPVSFGPGDPAQREPIINFIKDVFDGRLLG